MKIVRLYAGDDQKSHFEDIELKIRREPADVNHRLSCGYERRFSFAPAGLF